MKRRVFALLLTVIMALSLAAPALAYSTPDFSDVPSNHWAYEAVMKMADAGVIKGTGNGKFSPSMKLSAEMFVVLVGRVVFPDVKAEGADWSGPYITEAKAKGLLTGTNVTDANIKGDISRYDMAVILAKCVELLKVSATKADSSKVTDYGDIPNRYTDAVLMAYGSGLIRGDQSGSFNGQNSMTRQEAATVMDRLLGLKGSSSQGATTEPEKPEESEKPEDPEPPVEAQMMSLTGWLKYGSKGNPEKDGIGVDGVPFQLRYTEDNGLTYQIVAENVTQGKWEGIDSPGCFQFTTQVEKPIYDKAWNDEGQFYISAETTVNGQKYVTQDRRTDGKAFIVPIGKNWNRFFVDLVPPNGGETVDVHIYGSVRASTYIVDDDGHKRIKGYGSGGIVGESELTNSTVKIYFDPQQEGFAPVLIWETTGDGGSFNETMTIDTAYYRTTGKYYMVEIEAALDGQLCTNEYKGPITLSELTDRSGTLWPAVSDEFYEASHGYPRQ